MDLRKAAIAVNARMRAWVGVAARTV